MTETRVKRNLTKVLLAIVGFAVILAMPVQAEAAINSQINFQGKLTNPDGTNVTDGTYSIVFSIYTVSSGGAAVWAETQPSVDVDDGIFQVSLGSITGLPGSVDFNSNALYLGVKVGADAEMTPRIRFTAAPYAFNAERLGGITGSGYVQLSPGAQQTGNINVNGSITGGSSLAFSAAASASIQSASAQSLNITGNAASMFSTSAGQLTLQSGSGTVSLGTSTILTANTGLSIVSATTNALSLDSGTTGAVNVGAGANDKTVTVGNTSTGTVINQKIGTGGTAYTIQGSAVTYLAVDASTNNRIHIGGSSTAATPTLLVLGLKTAAGDPLTAVNGSMYYNSGNNKFRCYQSGAWQDCITHSKVTLGADVSDNAGACTMTDMTGMSFAVTSGTTYRFRATIIYTSAATGTGIGLAATGPAASIFAYNFSSALTTKTTGGGGGSAGTGGCTANSVSAAATGNSAVIEGVITPTANGTVQLRFASELNGSAVTIKSGSLLEWW